MTDKFNNAPAMALGKYLSYTTPGNARLTLMKLFFHAPPDLISEEDKDQVFFMYNFLENCEQKSPD
jgi:hypothetical protein